MSSPPRSRAIELYERLPELTAAFVAGIATIILVSWSHGRQWLPAVLPALATAVNLPESFFMRPEHDVATGTVFYRSMSSATKGARARAERNGWLSVARESWKNNPLRRARSNWPNACFKSGRADIAVSARAARITDKPRSHLVNLVGYGLQ